ILIDVRGLDTIGEVEGNTLSAGPGAVFDRLEARARQAGRELRVLPSNHPVATLGGFVAGGSAGIGSALHGFLWDGNVVEAEVLTAEDPPRRLRWSGEAVLPLLHTYGSVAVMTRITLALAPARTWQEAYAAFPDYGSAVRFAWEMVPAAGVPVRTLAAEQAPIPDFFTPLRGLFAPGESVVLLMAEAADLPRLEVLARTAGGRFGRWPPQPPLSQFSFNHSVLWARKADPHASWLQLAFDPGRLPEQVEALTARWAGRLYLHLDFIRRPDGSVLPYGRAVVPEGDLRGVEPVLEDCRRQGLTVINPHSYVAEEIGLAALFLDLGTVRRLKAVTDPFGLLNPGKLGGRFYRSPPVPGGTR
ncbi:MAG: FAD-binding oxidoreductase, partial [Firmicutes bacterium]|nr:FAD-binding oxidoreductase [Bacillota bacterium]